jgi:hypothetical protein
LSSTIKSKFIRCQAHGQSLLYLMMKRLQMESRIHRHLSYSQAINQIIILPLLKVQNGKSSI